MKAQGIWNGTISFSLVAIPVRLVRATAPGRVSFRMLHRTDHAPLTRRMFCPHHQQLVPPEEIIRGYEIEPDRYLPITEEELESITPERSRTIELLEFIAFDQIDPLYFDRAYYLIPQKGGEKAYCLLAEVLHQSNQVGVARFVLAEREHPVMVRSTQGALELTTLHYHHQLAAADAPPRQTANAELKKQIEQQVRAMLTEFNPTAYADARREKILALLKEKAGEQAMVQGPTLEAETDMGPPDLVAALEEIMHRMKETS